MVQLREETKSDLQNALSSFNSNMVQLRDEKPAAQMIFDLRFNSNMVQLRVKFGVESMKQKPVSIPIWFN